MTVEIDRKLRLTAALLGARTRKDLAAAFRRANPRTSFDVERANKWLQGRARPREQQVYEDWARVLGVDRGAAWIADCSYDDFLATVSAAAGEEAEVMERRARGFGGEAAARTLAEPPAPRFQGDLAGTFLSYSAAWSPYLAGRLIRGILTVERKSGGFAARYTQSRVQDSITAEGPVDTLQRALLMYLREPHGRTGFLFSLFPPRSVVTVLGGVMGGVAVLSPDPQPSFSRVVMIRMPEEAPDLTARDCLLEQEASVAEDLARFGSPLADPAEADRRIAAYFAVGIGPGVDPAGFAAYRGLVEVFDREWITHGFPDA